MKMNLGCGPDLLEGWFNVDSVYIDPYTEVWDMVRDNVREEWIRKFDHILVNHVFCTMSYEDVELALGKIRQMLVPNGCLEVIDMDPHKAYRSLERGDIEGLPGFEGSIDNAYTHHLVGHGRKSLWTPESMIEALERNKYHLVNNYHKSEYDLRPKESFVVKGFK